MLHIDVYQVQCKQWYDVSCSPKIPILTQDRGIVTMQTDKPTFERSGLPGKTKFVNGRHISSKSRICCRLFKRYCVNYDKVVSLEINRLKQYWNGEPHRQRENLIRACHSISTEELTWLLCDNTGSSQSPTLDPLRIPSFPLFTAFTAFM